MTKNHTFQNAKIEEFVKKKKKLTLKEFVFNVFSYCQQIQWKYQSRTLKWIGSARFLDFPLVPGIFSGHAFIRADL